MCYPYGASLFTSAWPVGPVGTDACSLPPLLPRRSGPRDLTVTEGERIVAVAAEWDETPYADQEHLSPPGPYAQYRGPNAVKKKGADCSGATWRIYGEAGFNYAYRHSAAWAGAVDEGRIPFRRLAATETLQPGDVLRFAGHLAIYAGDSKMWTARRSFYESNGEYKNRRFGLLAVSLWKKPVLARYRYQVAP